MNANNNETINSYEIKVKGISDGKWEEIRIFETLENVSLASLKTHIRFIFNSLPNVWEVRYNIVGSSQGHYSSDFERYNQLKENENTNKGIIESLKRWYESNDTGKIITMKTEDYHGDDSKTAYWAKAVWQGHTVQYVLDTATHRATITNNLYVWLYCYDGNDKNERIYKIKCKWGENENGESVAVMETIRRYK